MASYSFMNGRGKGSYGTQNSDQLHHMVIIDPDEAGRDSIHYYNVGMERYVFRTQTIVEHVAVPPVTDYSHGIQHVQHYGSPVKDHRHASQAKDDPISKSYGSTKHDYRHDSPMKNDLYKNYGVQLVRPPQVTDRRFGYPTKEMFKDDDGVDEFYKPPISVHDSQLDEACPPNSPYCRLKPPVYDHPEKAQEFVPNFQTRASQPARAASSNSTSYARPNSFDEDERGGYSVYDKDKSSDNPVFTKFRDLYLEYREGTNPKIKSKDDDYKKSSPPLSKPTYDVDTAKNFLMEGNKVSNGPAATKQAQFRGPGLDAAKQHGRYSTVPNSGENVSKTIDSKEALEKYDGAVANIRSKDDYKRSSRPLSKPTEDIDTATNFLTEGNKVSNVPATTKQAQFRGPGLEAAKQHAKYSPPPNPAEKFSRTIDSKEALEKYDGAVANIRSKDDYKKPTSKPTEEIGTAMNFPTEGYKLPNVPAATKKAHYWGPVLSLRKNNNHPEKTGSLEDAKQHAKNSPPPNSGEKFSRTINSKEAVEKYDGAFVPRST